MASNSFVRCKTFYCDTGNKKSRYIETDLFLMPSTAPSLKRTKRTKATFFEMDARILKLNPELLKQVLKEHPELQKLDPKEIRRYLDHKARQQDLNDARARRKCKLLAETNFNLGDYRLDLTYNEESLPEDFKAAEKVLSNFLRKLRRMAKAKGKELKFIGVTELGSINGRLHHHLLVGADCGLTREEIEEAWGRGFCHTDINRDNEKAIGYLLKAGRVYKGARLYKASRNLIKPTKTVSDTKVSKRKLKELTSGGEEAVREYFASKYPEYVVEKIYRYVPEEHLDELEEEQEKLWRDGFSYLRVCMRLKAKAKGVRHAHR